MSAAELLGSLLSERPPALSGVDPVAFFRSTRPVRERFPLPVDWAVAGGFAGDRVAGAFLSGYEAAVHVLVPALDVESIASFCVTEEAGAHPRAVRTTLEARPDGAAVLHGKKRWSTLAPLSDVLVVVATTGAGADGRPVLRAVMAPRASAGLTVTTMPETPFVPEVPHAEVSLDGVVVAERAVLPGDGYSAFVKPFRTIEDIHVQAAVLGYSLSVAVRFGFPLELRERLVSLVLAARAVAALDPTRSETHVALAGLLASIAEALASAEPHWARVEDAERARWYRDGGLAHVATKAREKRRERAWERLMGDRIE